MNILSFIAQIRESEVNIPKTDLNADSLNSLLKIVFAIIGSAALIILILTALKYNLSLGDPQKTGKAKNAIIYAGVGLAISVLAFSIVGFILDRL